MNLSRSSYFQNCNIIKLSVFLLLTNTIAIVICLTMNTIIIININIIHIINISIAVRNCYPPSLYWAPL